MHQSSTLLCTLLLILPAGLVQANTPDRNNIRIEHTNVSGGGFQSDVTVSSDGLIVYSSADVSGVFKSTDGGLLFESRNNGLLSTKVASLAITPDNPQILYAGTGDKGSSGGLLRSTDGGNSWALTGQGDKAQFAGNHSAKTDPLPKGHPRSNGDLIVVDHGRDAATYTDDIVIAGTYKTGVQLFTQGGETFASAVNATGFVRSVAHNSAVPNVAFAAIQFSDESQNGIYKIDYTTVSKATSTLMYPALRPEGLTVLSNGHVYAAIGAQGIVKYDGTSWSKHNTGLSINDKNRQWTAVAGYVTEQQAVIYAGANNMGGRLKGANYSNIWRTENGGNSWQPLVEANSNVSDTILGQQHDWWFRTKAFGEAGLGRTNSVVSSIAVVSATLSTLADDIIYVSGRGGLWKSSNGGKQWEPVVSNMQATANNGVAVNPNNPQQVALANTDYVVLETSAAFTNNNVSRDKPKGAESKGYDISFDAQSNTVLLGVGDRDTNNPGGGEVYIKSASKLGGNLASSWTNTNLSAATAANNGRVRAVTTGHHDGSSATSPIRLAAVEGEGVFRFHDGNWTKSKGIKIGATHRSDFVWPDNSNSGVVYLLDLSAGLYRSNDGGQTWSNIWPAMSLRNNHFFNTGYITADDNNPTTLYLSIQGDRDSPIGAKFKVLRLTNADTETFDSIKSKNITDIGKHSNKEAIKRPGPLVIGPTGQLWLTQQQHSKRQISAGLYVMQNPANDTSFLDLTTDEYRNAAIAPSGMDVSDDGYVYISQSGTGVLKIALPCAYHLGECHRA